MTLSELLMASLLLCGCVAASGQLQGMVVAAGMAEEQRQELRDRVDAELQAIDSQLRQMGVASDAAATCDGWVQRWREALAAQPPAEGVRRQQSAVAGQALLQVEVDALGLDEPRRRFWSPAAFGLCGAPTPEAATGPQSLSAGGG